MRLVAAGLIVMLAGCGTASVISTSQSVAPEATRPASPAATKQGTPSASADLSFDPVASESASAPSPTPSDSAATPSSGAAERWTPIAGHGAVWSPDGTQFVALDTGEVYRADGSAVLHSGLNDATWLDETTVVGFALVDGRQRPFTTDVATGGSAPIDPGRAVDYLLGNGHSAVAFSWPRDHEWPDTHFDYAVWQDGNISDAKDGFAQAWAPDGSAVAISHQFGRHRSPDGWISVVSWPASEPVYSDRPPFATGDVLFDAEGRHVAYHTALSEGPQGPFVVRVVDVQSGSTVDVPRDNSGGMFWTVNGELSLLAADGTLTTYNASGHVLGASMAPDSWGTASSDGSTVVFWDRDDPSQRLVVRRDGFLVTIRAPGEVNRVFVAPDGKGVVVDVAGYGSFYRQL
jgi:hypothetical protein